MSRKDRLVVLMGPSGCGKSTLALALSDQAGDAMLEADEFHSSANIAKMSSGKPLTNADRAAWVTTIKTAVEECETRNVWLACSALTSFVQTQLRAIKSREVIFVLLDVPADQLKRRVEQRKDHFMPPSLLQSQLADLATPKDALVINATTPVEQMVKQVLAALNE